MQLLFDRRVQIDDITVRRQYAPTVGIEHGTATGRQHNAVAHCQFGNHLAFALSEAGFAFALEDIRNIDAGARFDLVIAVDELQAAQLRQTPADRGDRTSVVKGKSVSVRVELGGRSYHKKK